MLRLLIYLFCGWSCLLSTLSAQGAKKPPAKTPVVCKFCKSKGGKPCKRHTKRLHRLEHQVDCCSVAADCETCQGGLIHDCTYCKNLTVEQAAKARLRLAKTWLKKRRELVDARLPKAKILHGKIDDIYLACSLPPLTVGKRKFSTHELMHLYLQRIKELRAEFVKVLELTEADFSVPIQVFLFEREASHLKICPLVTGQDGSGGTGRKLMGEHMVFSVWFSRQIYKGDEDFNRTVMHNVAHLLVNHIKPSVWIYNKKHGWIDAGLAHWFEYRMTGLSTNFCFEELRIRPGAGAKGGKFKVAARKMLADKKAPSLARFSTLNTDQLGLLEHVLAFAYVDHLITVHGGAKFRDFLRLIKQFKPTGEAIRAIYGSSMFDIDKEVKRWVKRKYPTR